MGRILGTWLIVGDSAISEGKGDSTPFVKWLPFLVGVAAVGLHTTFLFGHLPDERGLIGHDYAFWLPMLVIGAHWVTEHGLGAQPWFTPALCGGMPFLPNPETPFFSLPQVLVLFADPVSAIRITAVFFAVLGFSGTYLLLRRSFGVSVGAALLAATVFLFNETFMHRLFAGHFAWYALMLGPWVGLWILGESSRQTDAWHTPRDVLRMLGAAIALTVTIQAGSIHVLPPLGLGLLGLAMLWGLRGGRIGPVVARAAGAGLVAGALSAGKLTSLLAFHSHFPRDFYTIPGFEDIGTLLAVLGEALVIGGTSEMGKTLVNIRWHQGAHEFGFGLSPVPFLVIAAGLVWMSMEWGRRRGKRPPSSTRVLVLLGGLFVVLLVPLALNIYHPVWHDVLKSLPVLRSSSSMLRWLLVYTFLVPVLAGLALDRLPKGLRR